MTVEHHQVLSDGLAALISGQPDMELVGTAVSLDDAMECFARAEPDVALIDVDMPANLGLCVIRGMLRNRPGMRIIALVTYEWDELALAALDAGAQAFLPKDRIGERLLPLIREG